MTHTDENPLACTWDELKRRGKEFIDLAPTATSLDELDGAWSCVAYGYLNLTGAQPHEESQAPHLLNILARVKLQHEARLMSQPEPSLSRHAPRS